MVFLNPARRALQALLAIGVMGAAAAWAVVPANDDCANAYDISIAPYDFAGISDEATTDGSNGCTTSGKDVWFKITPAATALYTVSSCGSTFDSVISVHASDCPGTLGNQIACSDNDCDDDGRITMVLTQGVTYSIRIAGVNSAFGGYSFHIEGTPIPEPEVPEPGCKILYAVTSEPGGGSTTFLRTIDPATGQATDVGQIQGISGLVTAMAFDPVRNRFVLAANPGGSGNPHVYILNRSSLNVLSDSFIPVAGRIVDLAFDQDGLLFGYNESGTSGKLINIDPASGSLLTIDGTLYDGTFGGLTVNAANELIMVNNGSVLKLPKDGGPKTDLGTPIYFFNPPFSNGGPGLLELDTDPQTGKIFGLGTNGGGDFAVSGLVYFDEATNSVVPSVATGFEPSTAAFAFGCRCAPPDSVTDPSPFDGAVDSAFDVDLKWSQAAPAALVATTGGKDPGPSLVSGTKVYSSGPPADSASLFELSSYKYATDFYSPSAATIRSIRFWTLEGAPGYDSTGFPWSIRADGPSGPGAAISISAGFPTLREPTGRTVNGLTEYVNEINTGGVPLQRGTYWLTLAEGQNCVQDNVYWSVSGSLFGRITQSTEGCVPDNFLPVGDVSPDPAFELFGEQDSCDIASYDILLDTVNPPVASLVTGLSVPEFPITGLNPGTTYYWQVVTKTSSGTTPGPVWSFTTFSRPANDDCANAIDLISGYQNGSTIFATADGEGGCNGGGPDIWYRYVPSADGTVTIGACLSGFDTVITVHSGCPGTLANQLFCGDDSAGPDCAGTNRSELQFNGVAGQEYLIRVAGFNSFGNFATGNVTLLLDGPLPNRRDKGDFDSDGCTDLNDFLFLLDYWQTVSPIGGVEIGLNDFLALLDYWQSGPACP